MTKRTKRTKRTKPSNPILNTLRQMGEMATRHEVEGWHTDKALRRRAQMIGRLEGERGWWVRDYHSNFAIEQHLKGKEGSDASYSDTGPFRTKEQARKYAMG